MAIENRRFESEKVEAQALPEEELAAFLLLLSPEERLRIDLSEPGQIVINDKDGRLIDKVPRERTIMAQYEGGPAFPVGTLDHVMNLLKI